MKLQDSMTIFAARRGEVINLNAAKGRGGTGLDRFGLLDGRVHN